MIIAAAIRNIYVQVHAPEWAAPNLDALADVLRDLSWLPEGTVTLRVPRVDGPDAERLTSVLQQVVSETEHGLRPVRVCP